MVDAPMGDRPCSPPMVAPEDAPGVQGRETVGAVEPLRKKSEIERIKRHLKSRSLRDYALFVLGINTGLRVGDLLALTVGDVLEGTGRRLRVGVRLVIREQKTRKIKRIILNDTARRALNEYLKSRERRFPEDPLFLSRQRNGKDGSLRALSRKQVWKVLSDAARACHVGDTIGTHTMRKTFGYYRYKTGHPLEEIQKMLNHSSPAITLIYIGITQDQMDQSYRDVQL